MQRRDYLLRMIEQMGRIIARIRRLIAEGKLAEAGEELDQVALQGGIDLRFLVALDEHSLRPLLTTGGEIDRPKCALFAELLYLEWRRALAGGRTDRAPSIRDRALLLYRLAYDGVVVDPETEQRIQDLVIGEPSIQGVSDESRRADGT
jgi:hypothetical protein